MPTAEPVPSPDPPPVPRRRRRRWVVAGVALAVAVAGTVVTVRALSGGGSMHLRRTVTGTVPGGTPAPAAERILVDGDTVYFSYVIGGQLTLAAYRTDRGDHPLWLSHIGQSEEIAGFAVAEGVLVVILSCDVPCAPLLGLDARTGRRLWSEQLPAADVVGDANGYVAVRLTEGQTISDTVGLRLRTGEQVWRLDGGGGLNRIAQVPGTSHLVEYRNGSALRLIDLATGQPLATADISALVAGSTPEELSLSGDAGLLLVNHRQDTPVIADNPEGIVFSLADVRVRWHQPGRVTALAPGLFYVGNDTGRHVLDRNGRPLWKATDEVQVGTEPANWGYLTIVASHGPTTYRYVSLTTGRTLASDQREQAGFDSGGVIVRQRDGLHRARFWYLALPSGHRTGMGWLDAEWSSCRTTHTIMACFDNHGRPGIWRYR